MIFQIKNDEDLLKMEGIPPLMLLAPDQDFTLIDGKSKFTTVNRYWAGGSVTYYELVQKSQKAVF